MTYMENTGKNRVAGETRSQVAKRLVNESKRIERKVKIICAVDLVCTRDAFVYASDELQDFIGRKIYSI
jgi:hypothetical protein